MGYSALIEVIKKALTLGNTMKTYLAKTGEIKREHVLVDAASAPVGRLAVLIANALRGKDKPTYTPHIDTGAFVIVINAEKAVFTGRKAEEKDAEGSFGSCAVPQTACICWCGTSAHGAATAKTYIGVM